MASLFLFTIIGTRFRAKKHKKKNQNPPKIKTITYRLPLRVKFEGLRDNPVEFLIFANVFIKQSLESHLKKKNSKKFISTTRNTCSEWPKRKQLSS
jgi:hypothetical protein